MISERRSVVLNCYKCNILKFQFRAHYYIAFLGYLYSKFEILLLMTKNELRQKCLGIRKSMFKSWLHDNKEYFAFTMPFNSALN